MAIGAVMINRIYSQNIDGNIGCYEISSNHFEINSFYMCIDLSNKIIRFFKTKDFDQDPIRIVDYNKNEKLGCIPCIPMAVFTIVLRQAFKVLKMDTFPEHLHYMA